MDYIHLRDMEFYGYHGVLPEETKLGQRFRASVSLAVNTKKAGETDDLQYTVNYVEVYEICKSIIEGTPFSLIEKVAEEIASKILDTFEEKVYGCKVELVKPDPPIAGHYREVAVEIMRGRYDE